MFWRSSACWRSLYVFQKKKKKKSWYSFFIFGSHVPTLETVCLPFGERAVDKHLQQEREHVGVLPHRVESELAHRLEDAVHAHRSKGCPDDPRQTERNTLGHTQFLALFKAHVEVNVDDLTLGEKGQ